MDNKQRNILRRNHVPIVKDLEPRGKVLDTLLEDGVLTENDCERITNAPTRKERCQLLLHLIPTRGPGAYGSFQKALEAGHYDFLADQLKLDGHLGETTSIVADDTDKTNDVRNEGARYCDSCAAFLQKDGVCTWSEGSEISTLILEYGCLIMDNVEPKDVIDQLFQDDVLCVDGTDQVKAGITRRERCEILLQILLKEKKNNAVESFKMALSKKYYYIVQSMEKNRKAPTESTNENGTTRDIHAVQMLQIRQKTCDDSETETFVKTTGHTENASADSTEQEHGVDTIDGCHVNIRRSDKVVTVEKVHSKRATNVKKQRDNTKVATVADENKVPSIETKKPVEIVPSKEMAVIPSECTQKRHRLTVAFNYLSTLINQGEFDKYETISTCLRQRNSENFDMLCIIGYLNASRDLFRTDFDSAKKHINSTMEIVPRTSNPRYFILELFTAKTRMYITQKKLEKLQTTLDDAMMILETDREGCTGRAAGWLYINDARNITAQLSCLNLSKPNAFKLYEALFARAKTSFQRAMTNFKMDGGKDGPFGFGYALCRLVILLLRCGDNGMTMGVVRPTEDDVHSAGQYIQHLEDSDVNIPKIMDMHFRLAKCDYQFRRNNLVRSLEHAQTAYDLAVELNMLEFTEHAHNRLKYLRSAVPSIDTSNDISEDEAHKILFGGSLDTDGDGSTQSE